MPFSEFLRAAGRQYESEDYVPFLAGLSSLGGGDDLSELVWEDGQIHSTRVSRTPLVSSGIHSDAMECQGSLRKVGKFAEVESFLDDFSPAVPSSEVDFSQNDELAPWLGFPFDDSELFPEVSLDVENGMPTYSGGVASTHKPPQLPWPPENRAVLSSGGGSGVAPENQDQRRDVFNGGRRINKGGLPSSKPVNFSQFSKLKSAIVSSVMEMEEADKAQSTGFHVPSEPDAVASSSQQQPNFKENSENRQLSSCSSNLVRENHDGERAFDPNDRKRKSSLVEESGSHSHEPDSEHVCEKKHGSKRTRVAEVHNLSERRRRDRINEKMKALQELIPNSNKTDKASMLDEAIEYLKMLQFQVQMMSMGTGLCMQQMMYPPGMQMYPHFSPMGVAMGMQPGFGINMMDCSSSPFSAIPPQVPYFAPPGSGGVPVYRPPGSEPRAPPSCSSSGHSKQPCSSSGGTAN